MRQRGANGVRHRRQKPPRSNYMPSQGLFLANGVCWGLVRHHVADHCVGQHQDLPGDGDDRDTRGLATGFERGVVRLHPRTMPDGRDRRLIHPHAYLAAAPADVSLPGVRAAVLVERGQAYGGRDGLTTDLPNSGRKASRVRETWGPIPVIDCRISSLALEGGRAFDDGIHAIFQILDLTFEVVDVLVDALENLGRGLGNGRGMPLVFLGGQHGNWRAKRTHIGAQNGPT